jgi:hypothetical protein
MHRGDANVCLLAQIRVIRAHGFRDVSDDDAADKLAPQSPTSYSNNNPTDPVPSARFQVPRPGLNYERELRNRRRLIITEQQNGRRRREGKGGRQKTIEKMEESRISIDQMF